MKVSWDDDIPIYIYMESHKFPYINHIFPYINHIFMINRHKNHVPNHQKFTKVILNLQEAVHLHFFQQLQGRWVLLAAAAAPHDADVGADLRHLTRQRQVLQEILRSWTFCGKMADLPCGKFTSLWKITILNGKINHFYGNFR